MGAAKEALIYSIVTSITNVARDEFGPQSAFLRKHGLRRLARVEQVQQEATQNFVLSGIADRDFGDDVLEAFATMQCLCEFS